MIILGRETGGRGRKSLREKETGFSRGLTKKKTERERGKEAKKKRACFWREGADFAVSRLLMGEVFEIREWRGSA